MKYSHDDCIAAIQLVAWMTGQQRKNVTVNTYNSMGMTPSQGTIVNRVGSWSEAKQLASESPQLIPSHLPDFYRSAAALRRARDTAGYPVTALGYQDIEDKIGLSVAEIVAIGPKSPQPATVVEIASLRIVCNCAT